MAYLFEIFRKANLIKERPSAIANMLAEKVEMDEQQLRNVISSFFYILLNWSIKAIGPKELSEDLQKLGFQRNVIELMISNLKQLPNETLKSIRRVGAEHTLAEYAPVYIDAEVSLTTQSVHLDEDRFIGVIPAINFTLKIRKDDKIESHSCLMALEDFAEFIESLEKKRKIFKKLLQKSYKGIEEFFLADPLELEGEEKK